MNLHEFESFQWDEGNESKNWIRHQVSKFEAEQVFFNEPLLLFFDEKHSGEETRYYVLGKTDNDRKLMIVFTGRGKQIRVISARDMSKKKGKFMKAIPKFNSEEEERDFWAKHDSSEYIDWSHAEKASFSNLKPSLKSISIRLPEAMIEKLKVIANKKDVPYQSLMKVYLAEIIEKEYKKSA